MDSEDAVYVVGSRNSDWTGPGGKTPLQPYNGDENDFNMMVLKIDSNGAYKWHTFYRQFYRIFEYLVASDSADNIYVVGASNQSWGGPGGEAPLNPYDGAENDSNTAILKIDSNGAYLLHTFYGGAGAKNNANNLVSDNSDSIYIIGDSNNPWTGPGGKPPLNQYSDCEDIVIVKLNSI
ncbi:MAG: hypothetical protein GY854_23980 [Deltaproteobacteria bacterium]|nr:hypothetical protein [Deltaproteobacteria bacterium]